MTNTPSNDDLALAACPRCSSPSPELHPAVQHEGEVQICKHDFHLPRTSPPESATPPVGGPVANDADCEHAFIEVCDEAGCAYDNEALLQAIADLKCRTQPQEPARREADEKLGDLLAKVLSHSSVDEAMQDAWNDICSDTGCHPLDIEQGKGKVLTFSPRHWANQIAKRLFLRALRLSSPASRTASTGGEVEITRLRDSIAAIQKATVEGRVCNDVAWFDGITTLHDFCDQVLNGPDSDVPAQEPPANSIEQDGGIRDALAPFAKFGLGATVAAQTTGTLAANTTAGVGVKEALESAADWCETEGYKIGAVDGYDYRSGEEYGLRCAQIELRKRAKALASLPASALPQDGAAQREVRLREECDWPIGNFTFRDEPGAHDPCYVVLPCGAMLALNHHASEGVDIARAKFVIDACNAALSMLSEVERWKDVARTEALGRERMRNQATELTQRLSALSASVTAGREEKLREERNVLNNSFGGSAFHDGMVRQRIEEIDAELAALTGSPS